MTLFFIGFMLILLVIEILLIDIARKLNVLLDYFNLTKRLKKKKKKRK